MDEDSANESSSIMKGNKGLEFLNDKDKSEDDQTNNNTKG